MSIPLREPLDINQAQNKEKGSGREPNLSTSETHDVANETVAAVEAEAGGIAEVPEKEDKVTGAPFSQSDVETYLESITRHVGSNNIETSGLKERNETPTMQTPSGPIAPQGISVSIKNFE